MSIVHIERPADLGSSTFEVLCHFVRGRATFVTQDGQRFEFKAGDAAYFPPRTRGTWTIHETLRKTYCIWRPQ